MLDLQQSRAGSICPAIETECEKYVCNKNNLAFLWVATLSRTERDDYNVLNEILVMFLPGATSFWTSYKVVKSFQNKSYITAIFQCVLGNSQKRLLLATQAEPII